MRIKRLTFKKCLPVDGQLHWIQEVNCLLFVLRLKRHLKTGRAGLMVFSQTTPLCIDKCL